jgi:hypothetical protein
MSSSVVRYLNPFRYRREQERERRIAALRSRDGDHCRRCRRMLRFDLPDGHDQAASVEPIVNAANDQRVGLDDLCLTHIRCNASGADHTFEVSERIRRKAEAELFAKSRKRRRA